VPKNGPKGLIFLQKSKNTKNWPKIKINFGHLAKRMGFYRKEV
jgi:hypothetical protein